LLVAAQPSAAFVVAVPEALAVRKAGEGLAGVWAAVLVEVPGSAYLAPP
jgi:hypothetical protein